MIDKREVRVGAGVDVRVIRRNGSFYEGNVSAHESWITGSVVGVDDNAVTIFVHEAAERRTYPIDSPDWRPVRSRYAVLTGGDVEPGAG